MFAAPGARRGRPTSAMEQRLNLLTVSSGPKADQTAPGNSAFLEDAECLVIGFKPYPVETGAAEKREESNEERISISALRAAHPAAAAPLRRVGAMRSRDP